MTENRCELMNFQTNASNYGMAINAQSQQSNMGQAYSGLQQLSAINQWYPNPFYSDNYHYYYFGWGQTVVEKESKMDKVFKIIKSLMDKKIIKDDISVKEFMEICEVISKEV